MADGGIWSRRANLMTSRWRAVGGRLLVDGGTLRFEPHGFDRAFAADPWSVSADEVMAVGVAPRRPLSHVFGAGLRRQLVVEARGEKTYFVVNGVEDVAAELRSALGVGGRWG